MAACHLEAQIEHPDGSTETLELSSFETVKEFRMEDVAYAFVPRTLFNNLDEVNEGDDVYELYADGDREFAGTLEDVESEGSTKELVIESFEERAVNVAPTQGGERWENVEDVDVVNDAISNIPNLSAGTIENVEDGLTFIFSHASQAKKIREVAEATGAEVRYSPDRTIDYVGEMGEDKTSAIISASEGTVEDELTTDVDSGDRCTHLRVVGAGEGQHQVWANIVPVTDSTDYDNEYTYENDDWEDGDPERWETYSNKDITDEETLGVWGKTIVEELQLDVIEVSGKSRLDGQTMQLGDYFTFEHDPDDFSEELRVVELRTIFGPDGMVYDFTASNQAVTPADGDRREVEDLDRYNLAFEGDAVWATPGGSRQPVDDNTNYRIDFRLPDETEYIHRMKMQVIGFPYRFYASPTEHSHPFSVDVSHSHGTEPHDHGDIDVSHSHDAAGHDHDVSVSPSQHSHDIDPEQHDHDIEFEDQYGNDFDPADEHTHEVDIDATSEEDVPSTDFAFDGANIESGCSSSASHTFHNDAGLNAELFITGEAGVTTDPPVSVNISVHDGGSTDDTEIASTGLTVGSEDDWQAGLVASNDDRYFGNITVSVSAVDSGFNSVSVCDVTGTCIGRPPHTHDIDDTETSEVAAATVAERLLTTDEELLAASESTQAAIVEHKEVIETTESEVVVVDHEEVIESSTTDAEAGMEAGIQEESGETPTNVGLRVNSTTVETDIGSGSFSEEIDMLPYIDEFNIGGWNTIEVTSESLGHIQAQMDIDVYRQILGDG